MTPEEARTKLGAALADPRRQQLAHIAILEIAMTVRQALEAGGFSGSDVEEATEGISAYLTGELDLPPTDAKGQRLTEIVDQTLRQIGQDPSFAVLFG